MLSCCLKCGENTKSPQVSKAINDGTIILSKCDVRGRKKLLTNKNQKDY